MKKEKIRVVMMVLVYVLVITGLIFLIQGQRIIMSYEIKDHEETLKQAWVAARQTARPQYVSSLLLLCVSWLLASVAVRKNRDK